MDSAVVSDNVGNKHRQQIEETIKSQFPTPLGGGGGSTSGLTSNEPPHPIPSTGTTTNEGLKVSDVDVLRMIDLGGSANAENCDTTYGKERMEYLKKTGAIYEKSGEYYVVK